MGKKDNHGDTKSRRKLIIKDFGVLYLLGSEVRTVPVGTDFPPLRGSYLRNSGAERQDDKCPRRAWARALVSVS